MAIPQADVPPRKPLRLWPGVVAVALQWAGFLLARVFPDAAMYGILGAALAGLAVVVWWLFFSRAPWLERVGAIVLMVVAVVATTLFVHPSIANGGMGMLLYIYAIPVLSLALVAWAVASRRLSRRAEARIDGRRHPARVRSVHAHPDRRHHRRRRSDLHWRWTPTPEERLLAQGGDEPLRCPRLRPRRRRDAREPLPPPVAAEPPRPRRSATAAKPPKPAPHGPARARRAVPAATAAAARGRRMARLSRTRARRRRSRRADRDRLVRSRRRSSCGAGRSDRAGRPSRSAATSSTRRSSAATTRSSSCYELDHRRAGVEAPRRGPVLGVEWRRRSARDADAQQRSRLHVRCDRNPERARRRATAPSSGRATRRPTPARGPGLGLRELAARRRRRRHRRRRRPRSPPTTSPPASRAGSARRAAAATARRISRRSTESRRSCC